MKASILVRLKFLAQKHVEVVWEALEPEIRKPLTMRSRAYLQKDNNNMMVLRIEAKDTAALRASVNAYLRWISAINDCLSMLGREW